MNVLTIGDWIGLTLFLGGWAGYTFFANLQMKGHMNISRSLTILRGRWMRQMIKRDMRIADATVLGILQRTVTFFASTTIFILAGLLAVLGAGDKALRLAHALPFVAEHSQAAWEIKILLMVFVFIYAFFKFSWSVRQYNFALVMFGAAPSHEEEDYEEYVECANELLTSANNSFNFGLRAFTFSMATIAWFVHPIMFIFSTLWVVAILYRREFRSNTLNAMKAANRTFEKQ